MTEGGDRGALKRRIPKKIRRAVLARDEHRCQVADCTNSIWLDVHHIEHQGHGGSHAEDNLLVLCRIHHPALHRGALTVRDGQVIRLHEPEPIVLGRAAEWLLEFFTVQPAELAIHMGVSEHEAGARLRQLERAGRVARVPGGWHAVGCDEEGANRRWAEGP